MRRAIRRSRTAYAVILPPTTQGSVQGRDSRAARVSIGQRKAERGGTATCFDFLLVRSQQKGAVPGGARLEEACGLTGV